MWDPAHGKPYASAQLALSFGVGGLGPVSAQAVDKCSLGDLNCFLIMLLLSHHRGMLFHTGFVKVQDVALATQRSNVSRSS